MEEVVIHQKYEYIPERRDIYAREKKKINKEYDKKDEFMTPSGGACRVSRVIKEDALDIEGNVRPLQEYDKEKMLSIVEEFIKENINKREEVMIFIRKMMKKYSITFSPSILLYYYRIYANNNDINDKKKYESLLQTKTFRSQSGVIVITVFTSPTPETIIDGQLVQTNFSCKFDCYYCPNEPGQPRSYLLKEPGVHRANSNNFDPIYQLWDRANTYMAMGHPVDKIELLILGGTWHSYPSDYRQNFIRDIFYAANTYYEYLSKNKNNIRTSKTLEEEQLINQNSKCRIIGITIETRPDMISGNIIKELRRLGVTRVQLGVQSLDDRVLYRINRRCYNKDTIKAIRLLKDNCFKIDIHIMPDLPQPLKEGVSNTKEVFTIEDIDTSVSMYEVDRKMLETICYNPDYQIDQIKLYPCETLPWTRLEQDFKTGAYVPYGHQKERTEITPLHENLLYFLKNVPEWVRINRIIRDIPDFYILGGNLDVNMRNVLDTMCKERNIYSRDIRNREVKKRNIDPTTAILKVRKYIGSEGEEYFISFETPDEKILFGFLRLRLSKFSGRDYKTNNIIFPELDNCALIRELHVYGNVLKVGEKDNINQQHQHLGFGKKLIEKAINISLNNNYKKIAVISGIGVMNYYRKFGFEQDPNDYYMTKKIEKKNNKFILIFMIILYAIIIKLIFFL